MWKRQSAARQNLHGITVYHHQFNSISLSSTRPIRHFFAHRDPVCSPRAFFSTSIISPSHAFALLRTAPVRSVPYVYALHSLLTSTLVFRPHHFTISWRINRSDDTSYQEGEP